MNTTRHAVREQRATGRKAETDAIKHGGRDLPFTVVRSAQRQKSISVGVRAGEVRVLAPAWVKKDEIRRIVKERGDWIFERLAAAPPPDERPALASGHILMLMGDDIELQVERAQRTNVSARVVEGRMLVSIPATLPPGSEDEAIRHALRLFYDRVTLAMVEQYVVDLAPVVGKNPGRIYVREQTTRWGSCSPDGSLRFNWRLSMLPPSEVEYVVAHELCHLLQPNHSAAFWAEVARVLPGRGIGPKRVQASVRELPL